MKDTASNRQRNVMRRDILAAMERLLQKKTFIEVGIKEICAEAHISKPTFYRYFQNKDHILRWISQEAIRCGVAQVGRKYTWFEGYYLTQSVFYQHKRIFCDPQSPELTKTVIRYCAEYLKEVLIKTITEYKGVELTENLSFQIDAFNYAQGYMSRKWGEQGMLLPPRIFAEYVSSAVPHDLFTLLNTPSGRIAKQKPSR